MAFTESFNAHADACETAHALILEENRFLKGTGRAPDETLMQRKRAALATLTLTLDNLRGENGGGRMMTKEQRSAVERTQQLVMKTLLVDRENEQLLLKTTLAPRVTTPPPRPPMSQVQRLIACDLLLEVHETHESHERGARGSCEGMKLISSAHGNCHLEERG